MHGALLPIAIRLKVCIIGKEFGFCISPGGFTLIALQTKAAAGGRKLYLIRMSQRTRQQNHATRSSAVQTATGSFDNFCTAHCVKVKQIQIGVAAAISERQSVP